MRCEEKIRHRDELSALLSASKRMKLGFEKLRVYHCNKCNGWHLTSKKKENKMGAIKSGYGQKQSSQFKKRNQWKLINGDVVFSILPVSDRFTTDPYKWNQYHAAVYGYKNMEGKHRLFESTLQKKNKMIVVPDAAVERIENLKAALTKAISESNGALAKQLNELVGQRGTYSVDKKYHMNVMNLEGQVGTLAIPYTAKALLDKEISDLQAKGIDPLSLENGRYFVFSRSDTGAKTGFGVKVLKEEVEVPGHGKLEKDVVRKDLTTLWARIEEEMTDLSSIYQKITPDEVAQIVKESDLKSGKSPACNRIFDDRWKATREAKAPQGLPAPSFPEEDNPDADIEAVGGLDAVEALIQSTPASTPVSTTKPPYTPPVTPAKTPVPAQTTAQAVDEMSDDEFFKTIGVTA